MYAIIEFAGSQYKISPGMNFTAQKNGLKPAEIITVDKVLLTVDESTVNFGQPYLADTRVSLTVVKQQLGNKIKVVRFRAKSRYAKRSGIRPMNTIFKVDKIETKSEKTKTVKIKKK